MLDIVRIATGVRLAVCGTVLGVCCGCSDPPAAPARESSPSDVSRRAGPAAGVPDSASASPTELIVAGEPAQSAAAEPGLQIEQPAVPAAVFRPVDSRPLHDDARAAALGIHRYESKRLLLYTDIDAEVARTLPPLMDQAYAAFVEYFGPLPPARDGAEYQMTGFIMADQDRYREAGMLPQKASDLLVHGIHRGSEFWMNSQEYDYYQRHLMVHEGTHCFMTVLNGPRPSQWYMEGMAEYFGTHRLDADGRATFGVMPDHPVNFVGFGRVEMLREEVTAGKFHSLADVLSLTANDYIASRREPYAWSWAFCKFLDAHPRYQSLFRKLIDYQYAPGFNGRAESLLAPVVDDAAIEWELFVRNLEYGYDIERAAIEFWRGSPLAAGADVTIEVQAERGWQSSGVWLEAGAAYQLTTDGDVTLALEPKPWISEPQGVSIRYSAGRPIGRLVAAILSEAPPGPDGEGTLWRVIDVGRGVELTPETSGTLYLRVNDDWNSLKYNAGAYALQIARD